MSYKDSEAKKNNKTAELLSQAEEVLKKYYLQTNTKIFFVLCLSFIITA